MNVVEFLFFLMACATGLSTAWLVIALADRVGWKEPGFLTGEPRGTRLALDWTIVAVSGPRLLAENAWSMWRGHRIGTALFAVLALVVVGWSACSGVVLLQLVFLGGFLLS